MPNVNFNFNDLKDNAILMGARTAQSLYRKNSISALAKDLIMQYPVIISNDISTDSALVITKSLERQFASLQMLVLSADTAFGVDAGKNAGVRDLISKYHSNSDTPDMINYAGNVINNLGIVSKHIKSLESVSESEDSSIKIKSAHTVDRVVDKAVLDTLWSCPNDSVNMESVNSMYQPQNAVIDTISSIADGIENRNAVATEASPSEAFRNLAKDLNKNNPTQFDINRTVQVEYKKTKGKDTVTTVTKLPVRNEDGSLARDKDGKIKMKTKREVEVKDISVDGEEKRTTIFDRQKNQMSTVSMKKIEQKYADLVPTILEVEFFVHSENGSSIQKALIGVSAMPRVVPPDIMRSNIIKAMHHSHKGFNFIQYTKGEKKFVRDFIFNIKDIKDDALSRSKYDKWFAAMRKRRNNAKAFNTGNYGGSGTLNPLTSIVLSSNDVAAIKAISRVDLTNPTDAMKLMDSLYLLCLVIIDENTNMVSTMLDGQRDFMDTTLESMKKSNNDQTLNYANPKEILAHLGRR